MSQVPRTFAKHPGAQRKGQKVHCTLGGIYLLDNEASLKALLESPLAAQVTGHPALSDLSVKQSDAMEGATAVTRGPV
jgi:hypothetical protein